MFDPNAKQEQENAGAQEAEALNTANETAGEETQTEGEEIPG